MELLNIQQIEKYYGSKSSLTKAIDDISFSVAKGEFVAIMGASGSGKSTFMKMLTERIKLKKSISIPSTDRYLFYDEKQHILAAPNDDMDSLYVDDTQYELEIRMRKVNKDDLSTD